MPDLSPWIGWTVAYPLDGYTTADEKPLMMVGIITQAFPTGKVKVHSAECSALVEMDRLHPVVHRVGNWMNSIRAWDALPRPEVKRPDA